MGKREAKIQVAKEPRMAVGSGGGPQGHAVAREEMRRESAVPGQRGARGRHRGPSSSHSPGEEGQDVGSQVGRWADAGLAPLLLPRLKNGPCGSLS